MIIKLKNSILLTLEALVFISIINSSCQKLSENEKHLENNCEIKINDLTLAVIMDTTHVYYTLTPFIQFQANISITNKGKESCYLKFNDLFCSHYNGEIVAILPGYIPFKFYPFPFLMKYKIESTPDTIMPLETIKYSLETPLLDVFLHNGLKNKAELKEAIDSLKIYFKSNENPRFKIQFKNIDIRKSIKLITPYAIGSNVPGDL